MIDVVEDLVKGIVRFIPRFARFADFASELYVADATVRQDNDQEGESGGSD